MEYKSNIQGVVLNYQNKLKKASDVSALQRTIGTYLFADNLQRIHNQGLAVDNKGIGKYSLKPIYVNPKNSPKAFAPRGKTGKVKFKNGRPHKTGYFIGYAGFRGAIGREVARVNLQLTGRLRLDWAMEQKGKVLTLGFRSRYGTEVSRGNEQRFMTNIWGITQKNKDEIIKIQNEFIKKALAKN